MPKCQLCGKGPLKRKSVARTGTRGYVKRRTTKRQQPNLRRVKVQVGGTTKTMRICAQCLKTRVKKEKVQM
jgi:ribosomal protein L28